MLFNCDDRSQRILSVHASWRPKTAPVGIRTIPLGYFCSRGWVCRISSPNRNTPSLAVRMVISKVTENETVQIHCEIMSLETPSMANHFSHSSQDKNISSNGPLPKIDSSTRQKTTDKQHNQLTSIQSRDQIVNSLSKIYTLVKASLNKLPSMREQWYLR
jgi:hypothetical protein